MLANVLQIKSNKEITEIHYDGGHWNLKSILENGNIVNINSKLVIDATGRSSWFAHKNKVKKIQL